jgi:hypothetical protein
LHVPFEHTSVPAHFAPQAPQFAPSLVRRVSQPSLGSLSQFPQPTLHVKPQLAAIQAGVDWLGAVVHATPQLPQCCKLVSGVSQPLPGFPSQLP